MALPGMGQLPLRPDDNRGSREISRARTGAMVGGAIMNEPKVIRHRGVIFGYYIDQDPDDGKYYGELYNKDGKTIKDGVPGDTYRDCELAVQEEIKKAVQR